MHYMHKMVHTHTAHFTNMHACIQMCYVCTNILARHKHAEAKSGRQAGMEVYTCKARTLPIT